MMLKRLIIIVLLAWLLPDTSAKAGAGQSPGQPNIVLIMADDLGFSDLGCYGSEISTPNLDRIAHAGLRFTQFYNTSRCCPTRASLLTGLYSHQAGIGDMTTDQGLPGYRGHLTPNTVTLAEVLRGAGYQTAMVGKWHVANTRALQPKEKHLQWLAHQTDYPAFAPLSQYPVNRGFDRFYGTIWGVVNFFDPFSLVNGTEPVTTVPADYYYTDAINDTACTYIRDFSQRSKPFFVYVAHTAPHWPLHAPEEDIQKYAQTYTGGWDAIREARYRKMKQEGLFPAAADILPARWDSSVSWEQYPDKEWDAHAMAVRAAMIERMDTGIGRITRVLTETGCLDNTLIVFLSDNGASSDEAQRYGPGFDRHGSTRNGKPVAYPTDKEVLPGDEATFAGTDKRWSSVANTPFRYWKTEPFEGGICTPLIIHWPAGLQTAAGSITQQAGHVMDFMPTFAELAQASYPATYQGREITPSSGKSLVPILQGKQRKGHEFLFFEHLGRRAVRKGNWKLLKPAKGEWQLYNLESDRTEMNNIAGKYPGLVNELAIAWEKWATTHQVLPKP